MWWRLFLDALVSSINPIKIAFAIASNIKIPFITTIKVNPPQLKILKKSLVNGDFLYTRRDYFLKNLIVPGKYHHVAYWDTERQVVIEMQNDGYEETQLEDFLCRYTEVVVCKCTNFDSNYKTKFVRNLRSYSDKEYDSDFSFNTKAMYCSEMGFQADQGRKMEYIPEKVLWKTVILPYGLYKSKHMVRKFTIFLFKKKPKIVYN